MNHQFIFGMIFSNIAGKKLGLYQRDFGGGLTFYLKLNAQNLYFFIIFLVKLSDLLIDGL